MTRKETEMAREAVGGVWQKGGGGGRRRRMERGREVEMKEVGEMGQEG